MTSSWKWQRGICDQNVSASASSLAQQCKGWSQCRILHVLTKPENHLIPLNKSVWYLKEQIQMCQSNKMSISCPKQKLFLTRVQQWKTSDATTRRQSWQLSVLSACSKLAHIPIYAWWRHQMETFPRYWPFVWEFTGHRWIPTKASDAEFWCFLWSTPE